MRKKSKCWRLGLVTLLLLAWLLPVGQSAVGQDEPADQARAIFEQMSAPERVGQLFLITFRGHEVGRNDPITDLILNYKVGGVVLRAGNDNIGGRAIDDVPRQVVDLTNQLQMVSMIGEGAFITDTIHSDDRLPPATLSPSGMRIPLFIATRHEGDGAPYTEIRSGLTETPNAMAIGATWQPDLAEDVGQVVGRELSSLGFNLLLGPALDVLESPNPESPGDLGARSFGGDPYWVGLMGQAYTAGVHSGSDRRVAVIARHFPGQGSSDRPLGEEVSTVRKSLEQLRQMELAPFFAVTGRADQPENVVDGLMTTHIRYQGFQGNIQPDTPPVSFDPVALQELMSLPELEGWRQNGGLMVSDPLGVPAVQRFYSDADQQFPHRRVAKDALFAGNDVLYMDAFAQEAGDFQAQLTNIQDTITWFQEKYLTDPAFQQRVDEAVLRILRLKLRLYDEDFRLQNVLADSADLPDAVGQGDAAMLRLAQEAITLLSPSPAELAERVPTPPGPTDRIVIFTDVREASQCSGCPPQAYIGLTDIEERLLALYGPEGSEQIQDDRIQSFSFSDLKEFLAAGPERIPPPTPPPTPQPQEEEPSQEDQLLTPEAQRAPSTAYLVQTALDAADWIIFAQLDVTPDAPQSDALQEFLRQRQDVVRNSRIIVFAYNAPYFLDTTEVSKLTAYYGLYSKIDPFIDTSVRALFQETSLRGAPPVDVDSVNYNLDRVTRPDQEQVIELYVIRNGSPQAPPSEEPLELVVGDTLRLQTGVIYDQNGQPVPDGTMVQFVRQDRLEGFISVIGEQPTVNGMATLDYVLEARTGQFRITTVAGAASNSQQLDIVIEENEARAAVITSTPAPSATPTPTSTPTPTPTATSSPTPTASPTSIPLGDDEPSVDISLTDFEMLLGVFMGLLLTGSAGWTAARRNGHDDLSQRIRLVAWGFVGGLLAYNYYLLGLPGAGSLQAIGSWASLLTTIGGGLLGLLSGWLQMAGRLPAPKERLG